jgi:catechol 2,3-dioxygenase-like lactoylglutathione lyase family enzyme
VPAGRGIIPKEFMARIDHVAFESSDPDAAAAFYERILDARVVKAEGHPVMAYLGNTGVALHERTGPGFHLAFRVSEEEQAAIRGRLDAEGIEWRERDHGIGVGLFFADPEGRQIEAIFYRSGDDPRRPG